MSICALSTRRLDCGQSVGVAFDRQPVLEGELVELRPLRDEDFESLFGITSDPLLGEQHPSKDRTQRAVFQQWFDDAVASGGALTVVDRHDGRIIGTSRYDGFDE